jgi:Protein of unknown function (DUF3788)
VHFAKIRLVPSPETQEANHRAPSPCDGSFCLAFIPGDRAVKAARQSDLPKSVLKIIHDAPHYAEGTGVRLEVKRSADLGAIRKLALSKLAN